MSIETSKIKQAIAQQLKTYDVAKLASLLSRLEDMKGSETASTVFSAGARNAQIMIEKELESRTDEITVFAFEHVGVSID
jgi:hypothetical protein